MSRIEHATGARVPTRRRDFPVEWGDPPAHATTEEIAGWALGQIKWGRALRASGHEVRWLAKTSGHEARAQLEPGRDVPPAIAARLRTLQLAARRHGPA